VQIKLRQKGFTLVEIAIVLVIIGLLLGGILKGQEMITQARIKNVINDFNGITAAYASYQDRYRAVPGDDTGAGGRWTLDPGSNVPNGDGVVGGGYSDISAAPQPESRGFWWHLRQAGFIAGPTTSAGSPTTPAQASQQPSNAVGGMVGVTNANGTPANLGMAGLIICTSNIPDKIAIAADTQMDDQGPGSGTVRAHQQTAPNPPLGAAAATYQETGTIQYLVCKGV
jgi:prepilin-type N-terminal cleavage/methylation domain-containing protein